jgi:hypothetical protein
LLAFLAPLPPFPALAATAQSHFNPIAAAARRQFLPRNPSRYLSLSIATFRYAVTAFCWVAATIVIWYLFPLLLRQHGWKIASRDFFALLHFDN